MKNFKLIIGLSFLVAHTTLASQIESPLKEEAPKENSWARFCHRLIYPEVKPNQFDGLTKDVFAALMTTQQPKNFQFAFNDIWLMDTRSGYALCENSIGVFEVLERIYDNRCQATRNFLAGEPYKQLEESRQADSCLLAELIVRAYDLRPLAVGAQADDVTSFYEIAFAFEEKKLLTDAQWEQFKLFSDVLEHDRVFFSAKDEQKGRHNPHKSNSSSLRHDLRASVEKWFYCDPEVAMNRLIVLMSVLENDQVKSKFLESLQIFFGNARSHKVAKGMTPVELTLEQSYAEFYKFKKAFEQISLKGRFVQELLDVTRLEAKRDTKPTNTKIKNQLRMKRDLKDQNPLNYLFGLTSNVKIRLFMAQKLGYELSHMDSYLKHFKFSPINLQEQEAVAKLKRVLESQPPYVYQVLKAVAQVDASMPDNLRIFIDNQFANFARVLSQMHPLHPQQRFGRVSSVFTDPGHQQFDVSNLIGELKKRLGES